MKSSAVFTVHPRILRAVRSAVKGTTAGESPEAAAGYLLRCLATQPAKRRRGRPPA